MRSLFSILLVMFILPLAALARSDKSVCRGPSKTDDESDAMILTVCSEAGGMSALPRLRLYFRLYQSGRVEYEVAPTYDKLVLKKTKISAAEVAEIIKLGKESDFQKAKAEYPRFQIWTDSSLKTTIVFRNSAQEKKIVVNNYSVSDEDNDKHYPKSLLKLLQKIDELRPKD